VRPDDDTVHVVERAAAVTPDRVLAALLRDPVPVGAQRHRRRVELGGRDPAGEVVVGAVAVAYHNRPAYAAARVNAEAAPQTGGSAALL
jgi:hypothetical protein